MIDFEVKLFYTIKSKLSSPGIRRIIHYDSGFERTIMNGFARAFLYESALLTEPAIKGNENGHYPLCILLIRLAPLSL
jgi:hypothetical protein